MDGNDDYRSPQFRESIIKRLEGALKDRPLPYPRFSDPRALEATIFNQSQSKEEYMKKIQKIMQLAGQSAQHQQQPGGMQQQYEMNMGGGGPGGMAPNQGQQRMGPGPGQMMNMMDPMQQQTQQQQAPPNATISTGPLPPQQQQQHYPTMGGGGGPMDGQGRLLPPPNPYGQQQAMGGAMGPQQMNMQGQQQGNMVMNMGPGQPGQPQPGQHMMQPARMMARQAAPPGMRMGQPGMMMAEGQRYGMAPQERPQEFMRMAQPQRFVRTTLSQAQQHSMQQAPHWAGSGMSGGPPPPVQQTISDTVVVTHFGPGGMPMRHIQRDTMSNAGQQMYQTTMQQRPIMAQQPPPQAPPSIAGVQQRFEPPPRMPAAMQQQYQRHPAPTGQQLTAAAPNMPPTSVMGPPSVPTPGQYVMPMMQSPNTQPGIGPSPVGSTPQIGMVSLPDSSPGYPSGPIGSVGQPRYTAPTEPSPASQQANDVTVGPIAPEDPAYKEKIQELQMYLEPLRQRMLDQQQKDGGQITPQSQKLSRIIDIIEGKGRATLDLLLKCEETLKRMIPKEIPKTKESAICQPLFDVVASLAKASNANQTLKRVFDIAPMDLTNAKRLCAPKNPHDPTPRTIEEAYAMKAAARLAANTPTPPDPVKTTRTDSLASSTNSTSTSDKDTPKVPVSIQREVALLEPRFKIMFDRGVNTVESISIIPTKQDASSRCIHVVCDLEDQQLPHVPSLKLQIPNDYPVSSPKYDGELVDYCGSPFLDSLREMLLNRLTKLGVNCSITSLLDSWESTVKQACVSQG